MSQHQLPIPQRITEQATIRPSEQPAHQLAEPEPTAADLAAIDQLDHDQLDAHLQRLTVLAAVETHRVELVSLRAGVPHELDIDESTEPMAA